MVSLKKQIPEWKHFTTPQKSNVIRPPSKEPYYSEFRLARFYKEPLLSTEGKCSEQLSRSTNFPKPTFLSRTENPYKEIQYLLRGETVSEALRAKGIYQANRYSANKSIYSFTHATLSRQYKKPVMGVQGPLSRMEPFGVKLSFNRRPGFMSTDFNA